MVTWKPIYIEAIKVFITSLNQLCGKIDVTCDPIMEISALLDLESLKPYLSNLFFFLWKKDKTLTDWP